MTPDTFHAGDVCDCGHDGYDGHDMRQSPPACLTPGCICGLPDATADGATVHAVGRWVVRIAPTPALLWHGLRHDWTRSRASYESATTVEVYDPRYVEGFSHLGQFVTAYGARTLLGHRGPLSLMGYEPSWTMSAEEVTTMLGLIVQHGDLSF